MPLIVQKYGGSSLASPKLIQIAAGRIKDLKLSGSDVVVVASAMGNTTDHLLKLAAKTVKTPPSRELDMLLTAGERVSMSLLAMSLQERGIPAISFTGSQSGILTTSDHSEAKILEIRPQRIQEELQKGRVVIIAGFQGVSREKEITTLGRGGSDTTAVALAAVLKADRCEVLTDVEGIFTADPRIVPTARSFKNLSYDECIEFSRLGAKMHSRSIEMAKKHNVSVWIGSSQSKTNTGTCIGWTAEKGANVEKTSVTGIATQDGFHFFSALIDLKVLTSALSENGMYLKFFTFGGDQVKFLCQSADAEKIRDVLKQKAKGYQEVTKVSIVSAVGEGISNSNRILPQLLSSLDGHTNDTLLITTNSLSFTIAVLSGAKEQIAQSLHRRFIEEENL
ncbi:MAG: aspartate kinase [Proteobacteria bacterium]|nr:aspartate kinase [Pseudomonadota bacterium]NDC23620.1 aspartate kinase [Pseudomonadota bacterium]NDD03749.1 aspartate kinase [Pseudomonadota bacterium]